MDCTLSADNAFGPAVHGCRANFDFTLLFEQSFFQIAPSALLLLLFPLRASQLRSQNVKTSRTRIRVLKQVAILILAGTQLALIVLWGITPVYRTRASIPAAVLSFLASLVLIVLSSIEHSRSIRPSSIINTYMLFSLLLDLPQARTLWLRSGPRTLAGFYTAGVSAKVIVLYLEALSKKRSLLPPYRFYAPESLVSLYNRVLCLWLNPLFLEGFRGVLSFDRLYKIDADLVSDSVETNFQRRWKKWNGAKGKRPLFWALVVSLRETLFALVVPRLCLSAFKLCQPLLINRMVSLLSHTTTQRSENAGHGLIGATVVIYLGLAISNAMYRRQLHRLLTKIRGSLVTAIHSKVLISPSDKVSDNAALTLISADINRVCSSLQRIDDLFATPIEVAVAVFLLQRQIGVSSVAPVAFSVAISIASFYNSNSAVPMQMAWLAAVQERVAYTASVLGCPKGFKMLGLAPYLSERIQSLRVKELADYANYRKYVVHRNCFSHVPMQFAPIITLMVFTLVNGGSALTPAVAFTALSLITLLTSPIQELIHAVPLFQTALASLDRVQAFLILETGGGVEIQEHGSDAESERRRNVTDNAVEMHTLVPKTNDKPQTPILRLERGTVQLGKERKVVLQDIDLSIKHSSLTLVVGPVGSGKSTLLRIMIGDITLDEGVRAVRGVGADYAYCAQDPWLPNDTVRNLIIGQSEMDALWYITIVKACALDADISTFPLNDETIIGTKGLSLSGGQRQRLALARAMYSRKKVLFVDDALSGLDANTSQAVFSSVFGKRGLCRKNALTVVFATHSVQYFSEADHIIAIGANGRITEQGTFADLCAQSGYVHNLSTRATHEKSSDEVAMEVQQPLKAVTEASKLATAQEDLARRTGDVSVYRYYAKSIGWWCGSIILFTGISFGFTETFPGLWVRWWSEAEFNGNSNHPLGLWIGIYALFGVVSLTGMFTHIWVMLVNAVPKSSAQLHQQLLTAVMKAPYSFFVNTDSGVTLNRFSNDMMLIETELAGGVMMTLDGACMSIGSAALIATGASYVGAALPFVVAVLYAIQKFYLRTSRQLRFMDLESQAPLLTHCSETISGVTTIRAFGWQTHSHNKCLELLDNSQRPYYLLFCIQRWLNLVLDLTTAGIATIVVTLALTLPSTSSAGSIGVSMLNILSFNTTLSWLITSWTQMETSLGAVARCKNFEQGTISEDLPSESDIPPAEWPQAGKLTLKDVSASYETDGENVLKAISLSISAGEKVGICGRTGSGKSSLLLTILRLLDNKTGTISLDGLDLATTPRQIIRERLTALPQEAITFPGSLRENIDPLGKTSDAVILEALRKSSLFDIIQQRGGLDAKMSDLGFSHGQMQLFAVARAILRKSKLLVLDEMTSSVDAVTEETMLSLIREEFAESTVIAIAHRLKTIVDFDKIIVMDKVRIAEIGKPEELLANQHGYFRAMYDRSGH